MKQSRFVLLVVFLLTHICSNITAQELSDPEKNFEHLWKTFDMNYALFDAKKVDWQALYTVYRPQVTVETTDDELFTILTTMLGHLNDNHVRLSTQNPERYFSAGYLFEHFGKEGFSEFREMMSQRPVPETYFKEKLKESDNNVFAYGWVTDSIGYFHFRGFGNIGKSTEIIDMIIDEFKDAKAVIVDVRRNGGGDDRVGKLIADRFADKKRLYMTTQIRNGNKHTDFTEKKYWYVEPNGPVQFTKQVVLLTDRTSISAAENFTLAMRVLPHVTVIGDFTSGCFADVYGDELPNGWRFGCSFKLFLDYTGFCWEGIGVPSDIHQTNSKQALENGRDRVMDLAIRLLNNNILKPQDEHSSLQDIRESLVEVLGGEIDHNGIKSAVKTFRDHQSRDPNAYYIDMDELMALGQQLLAAGKAREAVDVFKISIEEFPNSLEGYENLADAFFELGDEKQAKEYYKKSLEINRRSYPWERESYIIAEKCIAGATILHKVLERAGDEQAIKKIVAGYYKNPAGYYVAEAEMNRLGYKYLGEEKVPEAIEIFKINVKEFPESWNVYDSLGEAYMVSGDKESAIKNYEKSVELNPNNRGGINALKKLREQ